MILGEEVFDLVIIGGGPVGSTAALLASRHGLRTLLVDASTEVFPLPRAIHFDADVMRIFQFAGVAEELEPLVRATSGALHTGVDGEPIRDFRVTAAEGDLGWKPHYMFYQPEVDGLLRARAAASPYVTALFGWTCDAPEQSNDGVTVTLTGPAGGVNTVEARYALGADGASSIVRRSLGIGLSDYGFEEPWVIIDGEVSDDTLGPDYSIMYCDPRRPGTYVPGPRAHRRWEFSLLPGERGEEFTTPEGAWSLISPVTPWLEQGNMTLERVAIYRFHALVAERWREGRIFLAGDAAHQTPPFYGQGMCHGIRDVRNLLWKLSAVVHGSAPESILDSYQVEREPHVRAIIAQSVANGRYICMFDIDEALARDAEMRALMAQPVKQVRSFRDTIPGLAAGIIDTDESVARGLLFPQPRIIDNAGARRRLDDLLGEDWVLVGRTAEDIPETASLPVIVAGRDFDDQGGLLEMWFAEFGCTIAVIRPDRYVFGTATGAADATALLARHATALSASARTA